MIRHCIRGVWLLKNFFFSPLEGPMLFIASGEIHRCNMVYYNDCMSTRMTDYVRFCLNCSSIFICIEPIFLNIIKAKNSLHWSHEFPTYLPRGTTNHSPRATVPQEWRERASYSACARAYSTSECHAWRQKFRHNEQKWEVMEEAVGRSTRGCSRTASARSILVRRSSGRPKLLRRCGSPAPETSKSLAGSSVVVFPWY